MAVRKKSLINLLFFIFVALLLCRFVTLFLLSNFRT